MGGKAFAQTHPSAKFPRMPPAVYNSLKARFLPRISEFYALVAVPHEAPGKPDHGDLDIIVTQPKISQVSHEQVKEALGATISIPCEGFRTSNFAVPVQPEDFSAIGIAESDQDDAYYQIDIHVCEDKDDWDRHVFFASYGDLGMLLGVLARSVGLHWSSHGLKVCLFTPLQYFRC